MGNGPGGRQSSCSSRMQRQSSNTVSWRDGDRNPANWAAASASFEHDASGATPITAAYPGSNRSQSSSVTAREVYFLRMMIGFVYASPMPVCLLLKGPVRLDFEHAAFWALTGFVAGQLLLFLK